MDWKQNSQLISMRCRTGISIKFLLFLVSVWGVYWFTSSGIISFVVWPVSCAFLQNGNTVQRLRFQLRLIFQTSALQSLQQVENFHRKITLQFNELRLISGYASLNADEMVAFHHRFTSEIDSLCQFAVQMTPKIVPPPISMTPHQEVASIKRSLGLLLSPRTGSLWDSARIRVRLMYSLFILTSLHNELITALIYAQNLLMPLPDIPNSHVFELSELRKLRSMLLDCVTVDVTLQRFLGKEQWSAALESFNDIGNKLEDCMNQYQINCHYFAQVLSEAGFGRFSVVQERLVSTQNRKVETREKPTFPEIEETVPEIEKGESGSDCSDTAYVYEGVSTAKTGTDLQPAPDVRTFRLSQRTMAELRDKMKGRAQAKVKVVRMEEKEDGQKEPSTIEPPPDPSLSTQTRQSAIALFSQLLTSSAAKPISAVLEA